MVIPKQSAIVLYVGIGGEVAGQLVQAGDGELRARMFCVPVRVVSPESEVVLSEAEVDHDLRVAFLKRNQSTSPEEKPIATRSPRAAMAT